MNGVFRALADGSGYSLCTASEDRVGKGRCNHTLSNIETYTKVIHDSSTNKEIDILDDERFSKKNILIRVRNKLINLNNQRLVKFCEISNTYVENELSIYVSARKLNTDILQISEYMNDIEYLRKANGITSNGFCDGKTCYIRDSGPHPEQTNIHEYVHYMADNSVYFSDTGGVYDSICGISINNRHKFFNEAITEMFTQDILKEEYEDNSAYKGIKDKVIELTKILGKDILKETYFQNKPKKLEAIIDHYTYSGGFNTFSDLLDKLQTAENIEEKNNLDLVITKFLNTLKEGYR